MSLAGEGERKVVKEIVKRANNPVKARVIPNEILAKYQKKLMNIDADVEKIINVLTPFTFSYSISICQSNFKSVQENRINRHHFMIFIRVAQEEKSESQISAMENQINRAEKLVKIDKSQGGKGGDQFAPMKRLWFQTHQERLDEKARFKLSGANAQDQAVEGGDGERVKKAKQRGENQKLKRQQRKKEQKKSKKAGEMTAEER